MMTRRQTKQSIRYENLENRCLLAADFVPATLDSGTHFTPEVEAQIDTREILANAANLVESKAEMLDVSDGADGLFGTLDQKTEAHEVSFVAPADGTANLVLSSSFGDASTEVAVRDGNGDLVTSSSVENLESFHQLAFDVDAGLEYFVTISSGGNGEGNFQMTVEFEEAPPVDLHSDTIGPDSTGLDMSQGEAFLSGNLETEGDVDTFQFQAAADGNISLYLGEMTAGNEIDLNVSVYDANGNLLESGSTNEFVETKIEVKQDATYYIAVSSGKGQSGGAYNLALHQPLETVVPTPVDQHADAIGNEATLLVQKEGTLFVSSALETPDDADAFRFIAAHDGAVSLDAAALSEGQNSDFSVSVFDELGTLLVQGVSNQHLGVQFDSVAGLEYHILVDSLNDSPASYQFNLGSEVAFSAEFVDSDLIVANLPIDNSLSHGGFAFSNGRLGERSLRQSAIDYLDNSLDVLDLLFSNDDPFGFRFDLVGR